MALRGLSMILVLYGAPLFLAGAVLYRLNASFRAFVDRVAPYWRMASALLMIFVGLFGAATVFFAAEEAIRATLAARASDPDLPFIIMTGLAGLGVGVIGLVLALSARRELAARPRG